MTDTKLMTKAEYARHRNVSKPTISKLIKNGRLLVTEDGLIDAEISDVLMEEFTRTSDNDLEVLSDTPSYALKRAELTGYKAELAKLDLEKAQGRFIDAELVGWEAFECARRVRDTLLSLPDRIAAILAAETDVRKVHSLLKQEIRQALEELSNGTDSDPSTVH